MTRLAAMLVTVSSISLAATQQTAPAIQFEVASVKVNASGDTTSYRMIPPAGGQVSITNAELREIITLAFQLSRQTVRFTMTGGTERLMRTRFDISAKLPDDAPPGQAPAMLRALLTQRFGLQTHRETRAIPVYALKLANTGRFGPNCRPSQHDCDTWVKAMGDGNAVILGRGVPEPSDANGKRISVRGAGTIAQLIRGVQGFADRPVIDMTGLAGNFEWDVKFVRSSLGNGVARGPNVPEMCTAFREQLGLELEPRIAPHDVLVIDRVEMPTAD
ncbi:MAG: TIGR03435 family protein [Vicinamibacterales bacterium]